MPLGIESSRTYGHAGTFGAPVACAPSPRKPNFVQLAVLALMTLVLALAGQTSVVRGAIRASEAPDRGVDGRPVADDNAVLPGKTFVRSQAGIQGPRAPVDHDSSSFVAGSAAGVAALAFPGRARSSDYHDARPQRSGLAYLARGPPATERWLHGDRASRARVAALHSVESFLPPRHAAPSRMMA